MLIVAPGPSAVAAVETVVSTRSGGGGVTITVTGVVPDAGGLPASVALTEKLNVPVCVVAVVQVNAPDAGSMTAPDGALTRPNVSACPSGSVADAVNVTAPPATTVCCCTGDTT